MAVDVETRNKEQQLAACKALEIEQEVVELWLRVVVTQDQWHQQHDC